MQFPFLDLSLSLGLYNSLLVLLNLLGLKNDLLLVLGGNEISNDFPSIHSAWWELSDTLGKHGYFFRSPIDGSFLGFSSLNLLESLGALLLLLSGLLVGLGLDDIEELADKLWD